MRIKSIEAGIGKITLVVLVCFVSALVYSIFKVIPFYYYYYELRNHAESLARVSDELSDDQLRQKMEEKMKELGIPAKTEDLVVERYLSQLRISLSYQEEFYLKFKGREHILKVFPFKIDVRRDY
jgi:hypothetical protein